MTAQLTPGAIKVLERRYLKRDDAGHVVETPDEMFRRVASNVAGAELRYEAGPGPEKAARDFYAVMSSLEFLPNSPTLMNAGRRLQQLAACFVMPVEDSIGSIFDAVKSTALIHQSGGGTGFSFSHLRPAGDVVSSTGGAASGPVSFMRVFNATTEAIKQGGTRRGANMGILRVDHPDIVEFITAKERPGEFTNFNLSVAVTDAFMEALERDGEYPLVNPRTGLETSRRRAAEVFDLIVRSAWSTGEPGVIFIDRVNAANPTPALGPMEATNPCGEQPLLAYEPCNLGSVNLSRMLKREDGRRVIDFDRLERVVRTGVRFLDDVIDASRYPSAEIDRMAKGNRKIGLGVMGFADMLARLRVPYASAEALDIAGRVMGFVRDTAWDESAALARERGPFPNIKGSVFDRPGARPVRNATVTTVAPTGTLSIIAGCTSGIEPFYALSYTRRVLDGEVIEELNPLVEEIAREEGFYSEDLIDFVARGGDLRERDDVPEAVKEIFATAFAIPAADHVRMQAAFQRHTDNAVSKTINLAPDSRPEDVKEAYLLAYALGCKGVTVYRARSRAGQVLTCAESLYC